MDLFSITTYKSVYVMNFTLVVHTLFKYLYIDSNVSQYLLILNIIIIIEILYKACFNLCLIRIVDSRLKIKKFNGL